MTDGDVIVVGGGAAGMLAALTAAKRNKKTILLEKNEKLGKKLFITGKGRCNVTNAADMEDLLNQVMTNRKFLYSAFYGFTNYDMMDYLEKLGCPLKTERGNRVFPVSDRSSDVIAALTRELRRLKVDVQYHAEVESLFINEDQVTGVRLRNGKSFHAESIIVATGGISYSSTGSTGDGYRLAEQAGHVVTECMPSLVPMNIKEEDCKRMQGLSLRNIEFSLRKGKKVFYHDFGELLFTHFGISGPVVLSASANLSIKNAKECGFLSQGEKKEEAIVEIDLKPALSEEQLDARILRDFEAYRGRQFKNCLDKLLPTKLIPVIIERSGIDPSKKVNEVSKEERQSLVMLLKHFTLHPIGFRDYKEAIITKGGVAVKEINPATMESKKIKGLYFAGEVLDLDAMTGGYNLQIAWSTGYAAGSHC